MSPENPKSFIKPVLSFAVGSSNIICFQLQFRHNMFKTLNLLKKNPSVVRLQCQFLNRLKKRYSEKGYKKNFSTSSVFGEKNNDTSSEKFQEKKTDEKPQIVSRETQTPYFVDEKEKDLVEELKKGPIHYPYKDPWDRCKKILLEDLKVGGRQVVKFITDVQIGDLEVKYFPRETDILIIGCSAVGLMAAYEIKSRFPFGPDIIVLDKNSNFPSVSTNLAQGTLMQQMFTDEEEIQISQYCAEFLSSFSRCTEVLNQPQFNVSYEPMGSLHLADESNAEKLLLKCEIMNKYNLNHKILNQETLKKKFPWINFDNILFGVLGLVNEGIFNPWSFLMALKCKAYNLGVKFLTAQAIDFGVSQNTLRNVICRLPDGSLNYINFCYCVLANGMDILKFVDIINKTGVSPLTVKLPIEKRKRYEYCFQNPDGPGINTPMLVNMDGTYFRREGLHSHYVAGVPRVSNFENEENIYNVLDNQIKPFFMKRFSNFEKFELVNGWADSYETNTANEVGITGPHPGENRIVYASGFNRLGFQCIPAVGRAIMEFIIYDNYKTIDFSPYHIDSLYRKQHLEAERKRKNLLQSQNRVALTE